MGFKEFKLYGKHVFVRASMPPNMRMTSEMDSDACFYYVLKGEGTMFSKAGRMEAKSGDSFVVECGTYVNELKAEEDHCYEAIGIHFHSDVIKKIYEKDVPDFLHVLDEVEPIHVERVPASELIENFIKSIEFYFENEELVTEELLSLKIKELLILLARTDQLDGVKRYLSGLFNPSEFEFKEVIENNCYNDVSVEELAQLNYMSLSTFKRKFKEVYNDNPATYLRTRKLNKSKQLLSNQSLRINEVAYDSGFNSTSHFSKIFLKHFGVSPSDYRAQLS